MAEAVPFCSCFAVSLRAGDGKPEKRDISGHFFIHRKMPEFRGVYAPWNGVISACIAELQVIRYDVGRDGKPGTASYRKESIYGKTGKRE